jgi:hypothetical protein
LTVGPSVAFTSVVGINGDTAPSDEHLQRLRSQLRGMAKEAKRNVAHRRNRVHVGGQVPKLPRFICEVCNSPWDFVLATKPIIPQISRCTECKQKLAEGYTALVGTPKINGSWLHAFVKSSVLEPGVVLKNLSDDTMAAVQKQLKDSNEPDAP